jgi:anti-anti-sigma factor
MNQLASIHLANEAGIVVAGITGEIDLSNADRLITKITDAVPNEAIGLIVDLGDVDFMDSAGIRMLLELAKRLEWRGQALRLVVAVEARVRKMLTISGLDSVIMVDGSLAKARESLGTGMAGL